MSKKYKAIVTVHTKDDWHKEIPIKSDATRKSFEYWHRESPKYGVKMYRASIDWYNADKNHFTKSWQFKNDKWTKIITPIKPDLIFDKVVSRKDYKLYNLKTAIYKKVKIFNSPSFRTILDNKLNQYIIFKKFMPETFLAQDKKELIISLKKIKTRKAVIKPVHGSGGFNIIIDNKEKIKNKKIKYPVIVQSFVDGSKGIPGQKEKKLADLRIVLINHKPVYALSRIAKGDSLFTNYHQGAHAKFVPLNKIPKKTIVVMSKIIDKIRIFPECQYSLDFIFSPQGKPILMEMNTTPGFDLLEELGDPNIKKKNLLEIIKVVK